MEQRSLTRNSSMDNRETEPQLIDAVDRALAILDCFSAQRPELGVSEISRELGMHKSTVFRSLATLEARALVAKDERTQRYTLGPKVLKLAAAYLSSVDVREKSRPIMERLKSRTSETVSLYVPAGDRCVCIERVESPLELRRVINVGDHAPLYPGSPGKVLLAYMPEQLRANLLSHIPVEALTHWSVTDSEGLEAQLALVRERGFAVSSEERLAGVSSASAPVFASTGVVIAALTVSGPRGRFAGDQGAQHARLVRQAAAEISMQMGYGMYLDTERR